MKLSLVCACFLILFSASFCISAGLEDAYREECQRLSNELVLQEKIITVITDYSERESAFRSEENEIRMRERRFEGSKADNIQARLAIARSQLENQQRAARFLAEVKGISESEARTINPSRELQFCKERRAVLTDKIKELKLRVLEKLGKLPEWWKDSPDVK